jgi:hypothetical protein
MSTKKPAGSDGPRLPRHGALSPVGSNQSLIRGRLTVSGLFFTAERLDIVARGRSGPEGMPTPEGLDRPAAARLSNPSGVETTVSPAPVPGVRCATPGCDIQPLRGKEQAGRPLYRGAVGGEPDTPRRLVYQRRGFPLRHP